MSGEHGRTGALNQTIRGGWSDFGVWDGLSTNVGGGGLKLGKLLLEAFTGGIIVQNFPGHIVDTVRYAGALSLGNSAEAFALGKVAADYPVISFIASPLTAGVRMAVVDGQLFVAVLVVLHALAVLEFGAIIHGDSLEGALGELRKSLTKGVYGSLGRFAENTDDYFVSGQAFCQDKEGFSLSLGLADHAVKLPVPEGGTGVYFFRAVLYAGALGRALGLNVMVGPLPFGLFQ